MSSCNMAPLPRPGASYTGVKPQEGEGAAGRGLVLSPSEVRMCPLRLRSLNN